MRPVCSREVLSDGTLNRDPNVEANWVQQMFTVPAGTLVAGTNSVSVTDGVWFPGTGFPLDDFMLKDAVLRVVPEPGIAIGIVVVAGLVAGGRRRRTK